MARRCPRDGRKRSSFGNAHTADMQTVDARIRVTPAAGGKVVVERLQDHGHWEVREYRAAEENVLVEVRPNGSLLPMGTGLVHSAKRPIRVDGSVLDTVLAELGQQAALPADPIQ